ncbi:Glycosyltransferase involved in cell wall bisynthesis [Trichlorobacter thiogenes]|uniref:Glycosyltransferase involved in cell wall bisynthesis n=1 Tax=Trichlorobacter thiogenes TaxID=115783 RepID=A0A1T4MTN2_9BACT|nr:Glycosyltransferase involved in cell wall bisynthesis [Trichlorobacter thiogenes]
MNMPEKPLRILMIAPTPYFSDRGCHVRIYEEAKALMALGHQVKIVSYHLGRDLEPVPVERTLPIPWYSKHEAGPSWHKPYLDLLLLCTSLRVARQFKPDLIHAHLHEGVLIGWLVARLRRIPLLFDYQGSLSGESLNHGFFGTGSLLHRLFRWTEGRINRLADLIITSSTPGRQELVKFWQVPLDQVVALPDGVDTTVFRYFPRTAARERLGLDDQVPLIVYLGLFNQYQGVDLLIHAARLMIQQGRNFHLLLMGYPEQEYRQLVDELNMNSFVSFTGRVDYAEAPQLLAAADLAVSPKISDTEANGKLLNYMACGLPVVAFDAPVNWELLGDDGIYAAFGDVVDLARCLSSALSDREALRQRGKRLRTRAVEQLAWEVRVKELEMVYKQLLAVEK